MRRHIHNDYRLLRHQRSRQRRSFKDKLHYKKYLKEKNRRKQGISKETRINIKRQSLTESIIHKQFKDYTHVFAPEIFSMVENPNKTINFINKLENLYNRKKKVFVRLKNVKVLGHGAIVCLLSLMIKFKSNDIKFNGDKPKDKRIYQLLEKSGFFKILYSEEGINLQDKFDLSDNQIFTHADKRVDPVLASKIMRTASKKIWGIDYRSTGVQQILLELMLNTNNHASLDRKGEHHWWITVNYDKRGNKATFAFLDYGVGILQSLSNNTTGSLFSTIKQFLTLNKDKQTSNQEILRLLLNGDIHGLKKYGFNNTATKKYYRGKGLPMIFDHSLNNKVDNLVVITNDVFANCKTNEYIALESSFSGTFVGWDLKSSNDYLK